VLDSGWRSGALWPFLVCCERDQAALAREAFACAGRAFGTPGGGGPDQKSWPGPDQKSWPGPDQKSWPGPRYPCGAIAGIHWGPAVCVSGEPRDSEVEMT